MYTEISDADKKQLLLFTKYLKSWGLETGTFEIYAYGELDGIRVDDLYEVKLQENSKLKIPPRVLEILKDLTEKGLQSKDVSYIYDANYSSIQYFFFVDKRMLEIDVHQEYITDQSSQMDENGRFIPELDLVFQVLEDLTNDSYLDLSYEGSGDSGSLNHTFDDTDLDVPSEVLDYCYEYLSNNYGGWEIDNGSAGVFNFDIPKKILTVSHTWYESNSDEQTIFSASLV